LGLHPIEFEAKGTRTNLRFKLADYEFRSRIVALLISSALR
jgi:hypothetical protein